MKDRLKILLMTPLYPNKNNPLEGIFVREYAKATGFCNDVVVLHTKATGLVRGKLWSTELETDETLTEGILTYRIRYFSIPRIGVFNRVLSVLQAFKRIVADGFRPDIIHAHFWPVGVPGIVIGGLYRRLVVVTEHGTGLPRGVIPKSGVKLARLVFRKADIVLPVSRGLQKSIESYGIKARFQVIANVVDTQLFHPPTRHSTKSLKRLLLVAFLGQGHEKKGIPYLLEALTQLRNKHDDWHMDIIGGGASRAGYEQMARDLALSEQVTFHGAKSKPEVAEFMRQCDVLVSSSVVETFGVTLIEALAS